MKKSTEVLIEAKRLLEEELEWHQGATFQYDADSHIVGACMVGAIELAALRLTGGYAAAFWDIWDSCVGAEAELVTVLPDIENLPASRNPIPIFNDRVDTTKEDVLLMFKRAIEHAEEEESL